MTTPRAAKSVSRGRRRAAFALESLEGRALLSTATTPLTPLLPTTSAQVLIEQDYLVFLGRQADTPGLTAWSNAVTNGTSQANVSRLIAGSNEALTYDVTRAYQTYLGRAPSQAEISQGIGLANYGASGDALQAQLIATTEFYQNAGGTNTGFVAAVYQDVLGRTPDAPGGNAWVNALNNGASRTTVAYDILTSQEAATRYVTGVYSEILGRAPDTPGLNFWVGQLESTGGHGPSISEQALQADFLNGQENLGRISTAVTANPTASAATIASSLIQTGTPTPPPPVTTSDNFILTPPSVNLGSILTGNTSPLTASFSVTNLSASQSLVFQPMLYTGLPTSTGTMPSPIPSSAITFLDASGKPISGPITLASFQSMTIQVKIDPTSLTNSGTTPELFSAAIGIFDQHALQIVTTASGASSTVALTLTVAPRPLV